MASELPERYTAEAEVMEEQYEEVAEEAEEDQKAVPDNAVRISDASEAPDGATVRQGERGGLYYLPPGVDADEEETSGDDGEADGGVLPAEIEETVTELAGCHGDFAKSDDICAEIHTRESDLEHLGGGDDREAYRTPDGGILKIAKGEDPSLPSPGGKRANEKAVETWEAAEGTDLEDHIVPVLDSAEDNSWIMTPEVEFGVSEEDAEAAREGIRETGWSCLDMSAKNFATLDGEVVLADLGDGCFPPEESEGDAE